MSINPKEAKPAKLLLQKKDWGRTLQPHQALKGSGRRAWPRQSPTCEERGKRPVAELLHVQLRKTPQEDRPVAVKTSPYMLKRNTRPGRQTQRLNQ